MGARWGDNAGREKEFNFQKQNENTAKVGGGWGHSYIDD